MDKVTLFYKYQNIKTLNKKTPQSLEAFFIF